MKGLNVPERFTGTIYFCMNSDPNSCLYGSMSVFEFDPSQFDDRIVVGQTEVDIPLDAKGTIDKQIAQLRKSKQKIIKDATDKADQIDEAIESLLAIEHEVSA